MKKSKKIITALVCIILIFSVCGGGYYGNMIGLFNKGNAGKYSVKKAQTLDSSLSGKAIIFLGSSVTYGFASMGESFADYLEKQDRIISVKEAVSGTTLVDDKNNSYVSRLKEIDKDIGADVFVCQLSTNDATQDKPLGKISGSFETDSFDTHTVTGAMEYIIAYAKETFDCPVVFYTGTKYDSENYRKMVDILLLLKEKWNIGVIDLWNNEEMNSVSGEDFRIYMNDDIHPTRKGYKEWWTPVFREYLQNMF